MSNFWANLDLTILPIKNRKIEKSGVYLLDTDFLQIENDCTFLMQDFEKNVEINIAKNCAVKIYLLDQLLDNISVKSDVKITAGSGVNLEFFRYSIVKNSKKTPDNISAKLIVEADSEECSLGYVHKTLALSNNFDLISRPELIIKNGNVKCRHSSSFQSVPQNVRQYLHARGLNSQDIEKIYEQSFIQELCNLVLTK